ncbi:MAG: hypothetical protein U0Q08_11415 [Dermatophilaceae bacterium]|jgi:diketogulonate reductase-like aldo/keto reductase
MTTSAFPTYTLNDGLVAPQVGFGTYPLRGEDGIAAMLVRSIGTSNYTEAHLAEVIAATGVTPSVNQIELHPEFPQAGLRDVHERLGIRTEAWRTLARMKTVPEPVAAAAAHGIEPGQVVLRWHLQLGVLPLPKSGDPVPGPEPRRLRRRAQRGRDGRDHRPRPPGRAPLRRRPRDPRGDVGMRRMP